MPLVRSTFTIWKHCSPYADYRLVAIGPAGTGRSCGRCGSTAIGSGVLTPSPFLEQEASEALFVAGELWQFSHCQALFAADAHGEADLRALIESAGWQHYGASLQAVADQDWVSSTQAQFPAPSIRKALGCPQFGIALPRTRLTNPHLDPGQAFGTGAHPTTSRCLHFLESHIRGGRYVIGGCGSSGLWP